MAEPRPAAHPMSFVFRARTGVPRRLMQWWFLPNYRGYRRILPRRLDIVSNFASPAVSLMCCPANNWRDRTLVSKGKKVVQLEYPCM